MKNGIIMEEEQVIESFERYLKKKNISYKKEVPLGNIRPDFVYIDKNNTFAVEAKGSCFKNELRNAFSQTLLYKKYVDYSYLLLPDDNVKYLDKYLIFRTGVGIITISKEGNIEEIISAEKERPNIKLRKLILNIFNEKANEHSNYRDIKKTCALFNLLSNEIRLSIISELSDNEKSVNEIISGMNFDQSAVSHALKILRKNGVVKFKSVGKNRIYYINLNKITKLFDDVEDIVGELR